MADLRQALQELQNLDTSNPGAWPTWIRIGAAALAFAVIIGLGVWQVVLPQLDTIDQLESKEQSLRKEFEEKQAKVASLDAYKAQLEEMERTFGSMLKQLPSKTEEANLVNDIAQARAAAGIDEQLYQPENSVRKDFYAEIPNKLRVQGGFHELGDFVSRVAALSRIVTIEQVQLTHVSDRGGKAVLKMEAIVKTYRYLDDDELQAQRKAQQTKKRGRK